MTGEKDQLIDRLLGERERFEEEIAHFKQNQLAELQVIDGWTVKDILAHITAWEIELMQWLESAAEGKSPNIPAPGEWNEHTERFNRLNYVENRDRPLVDILRSFEEVFDRLMFEVRALPDDPGDLFWSVWLDGKPPWDLLATYHQHYNEHGRQIEARLATGLLAGSSDMRGGKASI